METVNFHEAKSHLSRLLERVANGAVVVIERGGKPIAKIVRFSAPAPTRMKRLGFLKGEMRVPDDFDRMDESNIEPMFEG